MDKETALIIIISSGVLLWMAGGKWWKPWRRFIFPLVMYFIGIKLGLKQIDLICFTIANIIVYSLPYGEKTPWLGKFLTAIAFSLPSIIWGYTGWVFLTPIIFLVTFKLSNWKPTAKMFMWKVCEAITGLTVAITNCIVMIGK